MHPSHAPCMLLCLSPCSSLRHDDMFLQISSGAAHLAKTPFSNRGPWGSAWRDNRTFVGSLSYGVRYLLWQPDATTHAHNVPTHHMRPTPPPHQMLHADLGAHRCRHETYV